MDVDARDVMDVDAGYVSVAGLKVILFCFI